jgi:hypothetical protein
MPVTRRLLPRERANYLAESITSKSVRICAKKRLTLGLTLAQGPLAPASTIGLR